jgi:predicted DNA-binding transcriptional regulator AlpA
MTDLEFLTKKQVCAMVAVSPATIDRWEARGRFPARHGYGDLVTYRPRKRGGRYRRCYPRVYWIKAEVLAWMQEQIAKGKRQFLSYFNEERIPPES